MQDLGTGLLLAASLLNPCQPNALLHTADSEDDHG
jgi:hypothetical protein